MLNRIWIILVLCPLVLGCASCKWHEAEAVIAMADSIDQTQHVIYDDTAALGLVIRQLDNPMGRVFKHSTLGKAYYYMGRNLEDNHQQIAEAAECYIEADRLHIDDPIYRGRVNSCMGYICDQNNNDSLSLIFYERARDDFKESGDDWRCAQSLLSISENYISLHQFSVADSILQIASSYHLDSLYMARYYETKGFYFYEQQQLDSALMYFKKGLELRCGVIPYCYLRLMQIYLDMNNLSQAVLYARLLLEHSSYPNHLANAYYCLMLFAKSQNNTEQLSVYAHLRSDAQKMLRTVASKYTIAVSYLAEYLLNPYPRRWFWVTISGSAMLCVLLVLGIIVHRRYTIVKLQESVVSLQEANEKIDALSTRLEKQKKEQNSNNYDQYILKILKKYPTPPNRWNEYSQLRKDIESYLHDWLIALEQLGLTNREKVFCVLVFVYRHFTTIKIADHMNNTERAVRVLKTRVAQKLGITSAELIDYLLNLHVDK